MSAPTSQLEYGLEFNGRAVVLSEKQSEPIKSDEIRLRAEVSHVSIGTEIAYIEELGKKNQPTGLGYAMVGVIEELGTGVHDFTRGQRVLAYVNHRSASNVQVVPGALTPVPEKLSSEKAVLAVLGAIAYHIVQRAAPKLNEPTVVFGQGVVGSLIAQVARLCGVNPIVVDTDAERLRVARAVGFQTIDASREDCVARVKELTQGRGASLCIEAATNARAIGDAMKCLGMRGRLALTSTIFDPVGFLILEDFIERELTVLGAHAPKCPKEPNPYYLWTQLENRQAFMQAVCDGKLNVDHLVSHVVKPAEAPALYERLRAKDRSIVGMEIDWR